MHRLKKHNTQSPSKKVAVTSLANQGLCKYPHRKCDLLSLENYDYCLKHILEDKTAPYRPCMYLYTVSGRKCGKAAPYRPDHKDTLFCAEHRRKTSHQKQSSTLRQPPPETQEALLASLAHYAPKEKPSTDRREEHESEETVAKRTSQAINPFVEINAAQVNARCSQVLDCASESDSDVEAAVLDSVWRDQDHESSDAESVDSQAEDPLKYAGVYTAEEITIIIKDKMIRLQSLYIDQFRRLQHLLKERRRKYLHGLKKEKETLCSIHNDEKSTGKELKLYQKLKALNHYHRYFGEEAILHKKALERRAQATEGTFLRGSHKGKCAFTEGGVKCGAKTLPVTKYCRKHILEDTQQVLFRACGVKRDDHTCQEPTLNVFENATCVYHVTLPAQPHNTLEISIPSKDVKMEEETDKQIQENLAVANTLLSFGAPEVQTESILKTEPTDMSMVMSPSKPSTSASVKMAVEPILSAEELDVLTTTTTPEETKFDVTTNNAYSEEKHSTDTSVVPEHGYSAEPKSVLRSFDEDTSKEEENKMVFNTDEGAGSETETAVTTDTDVAENLELEMPDSSSVPKESENPVERMDVDSVNGTPNEEMPQQENIGDRLEMVDMISDVGVVEEVLDTEAKIETEESMQLETETENKTA